MKLVFQEFETENPFVIAFVSAAFCAGYNLKTIGYSEGCLLSVLLEEDSGEGVNVIKKLADKFLPFGGASYQVTIIRTDKTRASFGCAVAAA